MSLNFRRSIIKRCGGSENWTLAQDLHSPIDKTGTKITYLFYPSSYAYQKNKQNCSKFDNKEKFPPWGNIQNYEKEAGKNVMNSGLRLGVGE